MHNTSRIALHKCKTKVNNIFNYGILVQKVFAASAVWLHIRSNHKATVALSPYAFCALCLCVIIVKQLIQYYEVMIGAHL